MGNKPHPHSPDKRGKLHLGIHHSRSQLYADAFSIKRNTSHSLGHHPYTLTFLAPLMARQSHVMGVREHLQQ